MTTLQQELHDVITDLLAKWQADRDILCKMGLVSQDDAKEAIKIKHKVREILAKVEAI